MQHMQKYIIALCLAPVCERWWSDHNAGFIVRHRRYGLFGYASFAVSYRLVCHTWQTCVPHLAGLCATPVRRPPSVLQSHQVTKFPVSAMIPHR